MNQFLEKIKIWFLGVYDRTVAFCKEKWDEQRLICIAFLAAILLIILLLILIPYVVRGTSSVSKTLSDQIQELEIEPYLSIPSEPSIEDDYVYSRKNVTRWSDEAVNNWFSEPDDDMLDDLKKANDKLIDDMMEVVP